jgi:plastocyanin
MLTQRMMAAALCTLLLAGAGCKKSDSRAGSEPAQTAAITTIDWNTAGTISGTIHFAGKAPERVEIDMAQDPVCGVSPANSTEQYVVHQGGLKNVFVYVKDGLGNRVYPAPADPVVVDQKGCRFDPHVIGVMVGQPVKFTNSDPTMHNVHMTPQIGGNQTTDISQPPNGAGEMRTLATPELMIPVRCNNHPWMEAFINVASNPFFAVSDADGHFTIKGLPPGSYTIVADHEVLGQQTATVTVAAKQTSTQDFTYQKSGEGAAK